MKVKKIELNQVTRTDNANPDYYPGGLVRPYKEMPMSLPWWGPIPVLILAFAILKWMIYIKDEKRHGK